MRNLLVGMAVVAILVVGEGCGSGQQSTPASSGMGGMAGMGPSGAVTGKEMDKAFITGMGPHHQAAIDMARVELDKGKNPQAKALAQSIIQDQTRERSEMSDMFKREFGGSPQAGMMGGEAGTMMGVPIVMDMAGMAKMVDQSSNVDRTFLEMMIPHHAMAIDMADSELKRGSDAQLKTLAKNIIEAQAKEIGAMQALLPSIPG